MDPTHDPNWLPRHGKEPLAIEIEALNYVVFVKAQCEAVAGERRPVRFVMRPARPDDERREAVTV